MLQETFGTKKPIIAMVHFPPLPSTPLYDKAGGMQGVIVASGSAGRVACPEG